MSCDLTASFTISCVLSLTCFTCSLHHAAFAEHRLSLHAVAVCAQLQQQGGEDDIICFHRHPPFFDDNPFGIYQKILAGKLEFPRHLDFYVK